MATQLDYYEILEVTRTASAEEIKKSYRKMAMKFHPDRNPGDDAAEAKFKEINQAYDVLKDEQKRAAYDRFGHAAFEGGGAGPGGFDFNGFGGGGLGDIFEQMFGDMMGRRGGQARSGNDIQTHVEITLEEAFAGVEKDVRVITRVACDTCHAPVPTVVLPGWKPAQAATGRVRCVPSRAFLWWNGPARPAMARAAWSRTPAKLAVGKGLWSRNVP